MGAPSLNNARTACTAAGQRLKCAQKRILLVDDEPGVRNALALLLSLDEHTVVEAANGTEAFTLFRAGHFDLVITDFEMPLMKGDALARQIKQISSLQPILMITAYPEELGVAENPVDAILHKPFQLEELRRAMTDLLT